MNNKIPLITVIITTFNRSQIILQTIQSVLNQSYSNLEIIIVDDGSTDNTDQIVKSLNCSQIRYIKTNNWGGPARPRNIGIKHARGEYIAFLDDDDLWYSDKIEKSYNILNKSNYKIVFTDCDLIDEIGQFLELNKISKILSSIVKLLFLSGFKGFRKQSRMLLFNNFITLSSVMVHKDLIQKFKFNEEKKIIAAEDHLLWLKINTCYAIRYLDEKLVYYRISKNSISRDMLNRYQLNLEVSKMVDSWGLYSPKIIFCLNSISKLKFLMRKFIRKFVSVHRG